MKKIISVLAIISMLFSIIPASADGSKDIYTVTVAVEYDYEPDVVYSGINTAPGLIVYDKLDGMGSKQYFTEFDPESEKDRIVAVFDKPVDVEKIQEKLDRVPQFEVRDYEGNVLLDERHLSHATEYGRIFPNYDGSGYFYMEPDEYGSMEETANPQRPEVKTFLNFFFNDEGKELLKEVSDRLVQQEEGKNRLYIYINEQYICSYKAKANNNAGSLAYVGKTEEEHSVLSFSVMAKGEYLMPKMAKVIKTDGPYNLNCSDWAFNYVLAMYSNGVISLNDGTDYTEAVTREEFCEYAAKIIEGQSREFLDINDYKSKFKDTKSREVAMLYEFGIINGKGEGIFAPDDNITREESSAIVCRMFKYLSGIELSADSEYKFIDDEEISDWAKESVYASYSGNLMNGTGDDKFDPKGTFTKEQAFVTFHRIILEKMKTEDWYQG